MKISAISIFPDYFSVLYLSLIGKAGDKGLLDFEAIDLRQFTTDKHRSVDDTPYGGGAGMLMKPEPWGEALDHTRTAESLVIFPSPSGEPFSQAIAAELACESHLVFACGRYEGIDERVYLYAEATGRARRISLGDYVLNGGEVAALAIIEATVRLLPGVLGNAESLVEESHNDQLLEYPSYTKPAVWRGMEVPEVLLSGNHAAIATWRRDQQLDRTRRWRPDLLQDDSETN